MTMTPNCEKGLFYSGLAAVDPELGEIVAEFVAEMPDRISAMQRQLEDRNWQALRQSAHQLKGAAGSYGFERVSPAAAQLENALRDEKPEETVRCAVEELIDLCRRMRAGTPEN
ncbi:MAG: Hpt domain-containing protein [Pirellulales bacterium]|nr:Hpt domain-containing protein [Pirellulales bacterium]